MDPLSLSKIAALSAADFVTGNPDATVFRIINDTRHIKAGDLYVALRGERFDGNNFIKEAAEKGAVGALYDGDAPAELPSSFGLLKVSNTLKSLTDLAAAWRKVLPLRSVVLTGSSGKTSTKDFAAAVLRSKLRVNCTQGNFNNHIGLPLSILTASTDDQVAVWEIGMNHRGEIAPLAALAEPDIAVITNIGTAHIGFLGSCEVIAEEKGDLLAALPSSGVAILPADDVFCDRLAKRTQARVVRVGIGIGDLQATNLTATTEGTHFEISYQGTSHAAFLPVIGQHMVTNALLALAIGLECGVSLEIGIEALKNITPSKSRLSVHYLNKVTLIDDAYNANPDSMEAALSTMASLPSQGRCIAVLGRMGELGDYESEGYQRVGVAAAKVLDILIVVGHDVSLLAQTARDAGMNDVYVVENNKEAIDSLISLARSGDMILVKGSNAAGMKEVVNSCQRHFISSK
ncbi:MAG: hypothetical protein A3F67_05565 [Verrucomicrobia bacterium RIFCSPHIGHO2_12_FULL_41_10]|nr:MAG: hypothetical protein A3F67_05565 [Verrucomicrobia bacterium RIFCSPHIGHO2_12_FULL_41_10]HLB32619.1 UDP-N-acetylmuramoyl-tripeptide--D-alanyl-D-alanine ligase [Chthoniobacterales bacterium]